MHPEAPPPVVTAEVTLRSDDWQLQCRMTVPVGPTHLSDLLPLVRAMSDAVVGETMQCLEQAGETVSCKQGVGPVAASSSPSPKSKRGASATSWMLSPSQGAPWSAPALSTLNAVWLMPGCCSPSNRPSSCRTPSTEPWPSRTSRSTSRARFSRRNPVRSTRNARSPAGNTW